MEFCLCFGSVGRTREEEEKKFGRPDREKPEPPEMNAPTKEGAVAL